MIRLTDILYEACWDGYKQVGMKDKGGNQVPNCVPVNEDSNDTIECAKCDWEWNLADGGEDPYTCHKCGYDNSDEYGELNVEDYCTECLIEVLQGKHPEQLGEAEYHGRTVPLGKPMRGDVKKFKVFVRDPSIGNIKKVNFGHGGTSAKRRGEKTMKIKKNIPSRRKAFRARHNCATAKDRTSARYWSCSKW